MSELANQNVVITGGAGGLGKQIALEVIRRGGRPVLWDIHEDNLDRVRKEIEAETERSPHVEVVDLADRDAIYTAAERTRAAVGHVRVLVNNAGVVSGKPFLELADESIEQSFRVNALALFWTAKAFLPDMIERNAGHVVTVASASGLIGVARLADYAATKWAAVGFDESLRMELRKRSPGVKTTVVCPYFINTGMFEGVKTRFPMLLPILEEHDVARKVVAAIVGDRPRVLMPPIVNLVPVFRALPVAAFDAVADLLGINMAMDHFVGRAVTKKAPRKTRPPLRIADETATAGKRSRRSR